MEITVKNKFIGISPRKMRPILHGLSSQTLSDALISLKFVNRKGAYFAHSLVKSAIAAAKENYLEADKVVISRFVCEEGPRLKRIMPWSKGQARRITKRMAHLVLTVEGVEDKKVEIEPVKKSEKTKSEEVK